jgi:hypothetical protein
LTRDCTMAVPDSLDLFFVAVPRIEVNSCIHRNVMLNANQSLPRALMRTSVRSATFQCHCFESLFVCEWIIGSRERERDVREEKAETTTSIEREREHRHKDMMENVRTIPREEIYTLTHTPPTLIAPSRGT